MHTLRFHVGSHFCTPRTQSLGSVLLGRHHVKPAANIGLVSSHVFRSETTPATQQSASQQQVRQPPCCTNHTSVARTWQNLLLYAMKPQAYMLIVVIRLRRARDTTVHRHNLLELFSQSTTSSRPASQSAQPHLSRAHMLSVMIFLTTA